MFRADFCSLNRVDDDIRRIGRSMRPLRCGLQPVVRSVEIATNSLRLCRVISTGWRWI